MIMAADVTKKNILTWLFVVLVLVMLAMVLVFIKVLVLQSDDSWKSKISTIKVVDVEPFRGDICAYDGRILATSMPMYSIHWDLSVSGLSDTLFYNNVDSLARCLANLFADSSAESYSKRFREGYARHSKYLLVRNSVTFSQLSSICKFPIFNIGRRKIGLIYEQRYERRQPHNSLAARTLGYIRDGHGVVGMEVAYDDKLSGAKGSKLMKKLSTGEMFPVNSYSDVEPVDGMDVISTIDVNLQDIVEKSLRRKLSAHNAESGIAIVMEVSTGKIRAIANLSKNKNGDYIENENKAVTMAAEPGSTFKIPAIMAYLDKTGASIHDSINLGYDGNFVYYGHKIKDDHPLKGWVSIKEIVEHSSNVGMSKLIISAFEDSKEEFVSRLYNMGLNKPSGIDLLGEAQPFIRFPKDPGWSMASIAVMSYGYEIQLTPMQILTYYNAIANNGKMMRPYLMEEVRSHGEVVEVSKPEVVNSAICSKETLEKVQVLLKSVVDNGTGKVIKNPLYGIAGKTGTAQIAQGSTGYEGAQGKVYMASFAGYFPTDNPKYSCIVVITAPTQGSYYASSVACPVFKDIADKLYSQDRELHNGKNFDLMQSDDIKDNLPGIKAGDREILDRLCSMFNIPLSNVEASQTPYVMPTVHNGTVRLESLASSVHVVPDVKNMGLRDAMYILRNRGIKVKVVGRGVVKKQSIPPSTTVKDGMTMILELG